MTRVVVPGGTLIHPIPVRVDPLTVNRETSYRFDLLDDTGNKFGELDGVSSGSVEWDSSAAVQGGGKIVVARDNDVHKRNIRVAKNRPLVEERDFEIAVGGFAGDTDGGAFSLPASVTRNVDVHYEYAASLDVEWAAAGTPQTQNVVSTFNGLNVGDTYTFVLRVLNQDADQVYVRSGSASPVDVKPGWQTIAVTFDATNTSADLHIRNTTPTAGTHTYVDYLALYKGTTDHFNGEHFEYAPFSWLHARIRPVLMIEGVKDETLGVFIPAAPTEQWDENAGQQEVELLDRTSALAQDYVEHTYTVSKDTNVIAAVRKLIRSTGEKSGALSDSDDTLHADMSWEAGTNKLTIVNDLLDAAGFFPLWADSNGQFQAQKYRKPKNRPIKFEFIDNQDSIYDPTFSIDNDIYSIPNKVVLTAQGDDDNEGWTAIATNEREDSPYSYQNRGRWITDIQTGVEATSEANLQDKASRRLHDLTSVQSTIEIQHAPVPGLKPNNVVQFRRKPAGVNTQFVVSKTSIDFDPLGLCQTTLTEVLDLD
jgi:hypothetical protein